MFVYVAFDERFNDAFLYPKRRGYVRFGRLVYVVQIQTLDMRAGTETKQCAVRGFGFMAADVSNCHVAANGSSAKF